MKLARDILLLLAVAGRIATADPAPTTDRALDAQVDQLMAKMTLEEKLLQLLSYKPNGVPRLGIPHLEAGEALHGVVTGGATSFPQSIALGATWDPGLVERVMTVVAKEARAVGVVQVFAPMLGLARDARWGRIEESYGEDPFLVGEIAVGAVNGYQGRGAERFGPDRVIATAKHFVADGEPWSGANGEDFETSDRVLREVYMPPFEAVVKRAHIGSIMPAHHALNGIPCHMNPGLLDEVLRREWGFDGFITSDMGDIPKLAGGHRMARDAQEAAIFSVRSGVDMELVGSLYMREIRQAVKDGKIDVEFINRSARRVLWAKLQILGLVPEETATSEPPSEKTRQEILNYKGDDDIWAKLIEQGRFNTPESARRSDRKETLNDPAHDALALEAAEKAIVLLKNDAAILPLDKARLKKLLVVGPLADQRNLGGYSTGQPKLYAKLVPSLQKLLGPGVTVAYEPGCKLTDESADGIARAVAQAKDADAILAVVGHSRGQVGENLDRDNLSLIGGQLKLVQAMQATGRPVVVIFQNGAPIGEPWIAQNIPAIVESWYLGQATGDALARMLFGEVNPGGRLPVTIPRSVGQIPCYYNHPQFHGPRNFYGSTFGPLYPFGHGLSYTTFAYGSLKVEPPAIAGDQTATVSFTVSNTGSHSGDEVAQLYLRQDYTSLKRPALELKGFRRVTLKPGESTTISFPVGFEQVKFWKEGRWVSEPGTINLLVGSSSADIRQRGRFTLTAGREVAVP